MMSVAKGTFNTPRVGYSVLELLVRNQCHHLITLYKGCQEQLWVFFFHDLLFLETIQEEHIITQG